MQISALRGPLHLALIADDTQFYFVAIVIFSTTLVCISTECLKTHKHFNEGEAKLRKRNGYLSVLRSLTTFEFTLCVDNKVSKDRYCRFIKQDIVKKGVFVHVMVVCNST